MKKEKKTIPMKKNPEFIETKSKRVQLLMQPSLHHRILKEAKLQETSVNDVIHTILNNHLNDKNS